MIGDLMSVRIVAWPPKARTVSRKAPIVNVDSGHAEAIPGHRLEIAHHVRHAGIASDVHALTIRICQLCPQGCSQAKAEGGDVAPAQETTRNLRLVDRTDLIAGVPRVASNEGIL